MNPTHEAPQPTPERTMSWAGIYTLVAVCAVAVMLVLWWFTASFNIPLGDG